MKKKSITVTITIICMLLFIAFLAGCGHDRKLKTGNYAVTSIDASEEAESNDFLEIPFDEGYGIILSDVRGTTAERNISIYLSEGEDDNSFNFSTNAIDTWMGMGDGLIQGTYEIDNENGQITFHYGFENEIETTGRCTGSTIEIDVPGGTYRFSHADSVSPDYDSVETFAVDEIEFGFAESFYGKAFDYLGMTFRNIEDTYGNLSQQATWNGAIYYMTPDERYLGFQTALLDNGEMQAMAPCISYIGSPSELFNVVDDITLDEFAAVLGQDYDYDTYYDYDNDMNNTIIWYITKDNIEYKLIIEYDENLMPRIITLTYSEE